MNLILENGVVNGKPTVWAAFDKEKWWVGDVYPTSPPPTTSQEDDNKKK